MDNTIEKLGKYEIKRQLGRGAMGVVYEGWDPIIERRVAIKTVRLPEEPDEDTAEEIARFRREAQAAGRLTHPNIVGVFDYGETGDLAYIVMEFVDGPPVKALLDKHERFAMPDIIRIMDDLLAGLQFSHDRGVVHRDIKPANLMLTSSGQAKIADFGIARIESSSMTQAGTVLGTPAYMSPEQFMGQVVDARSDLYSSGVLLYQLLTGERPFEGGMSAIMHKALNTEPPAPSQISVTCPAAFDGVIRKAMAKRPEDRFASATVFAEAIRNAAAGRPLAVDTPHADADEATLVLPSRGAARSAATPPAAAPAQAAPVAAAAGGKKSPMPMIAAAAAAVVVLGGGGAWYFLAGPGGSPAPAAAPAAAIAPAAPSATPPAAAPTPTQPAAQTPSAAVPPAPPPSPAAQATAPTQPAPAATPAEPANAAATGSAPGGPVQLAAAGVDGIRRQITQLTASQTCGIFDGDVQDTGTVDLGGIASASAASAVRQALGGMPIQQPVKWTVGTADAVFCPALEVLHPISHGFGTAGSRLKLGLADGKTRLQDGQRILPRLVMPDFRGQLRVDYIAHDGGVLHLYPQLADAKQGLASDPVRTFAPNDTVNLGDPAPGHPAWEVAEPFGTDMIIAIASSQPLFEKPRPANIEAAKDYLRALKDAVEAARRRNVTVVGNALLVDTVPK